MKKKKKREKQEKQEKQAKNLNVARGVTAEEVKKGANETLPKVDPQEIVIEKMRRIFGEDELKVRKVPNARAEKPVQVVDFSSGDELMVFNDILRGTIQSESDDSDSVKNALRLAEAKKVKAIMFTGDITYSPMQRHGSQRTYKAQVSGIKLDFKKLEDECPDIVKKSEGYESNEVRFKKGKPVFISQKQRLDLSIKMLRDTFVDKNGKPLYSGPVLINFGKMEDELIMFYANEYLRIGLFEGRSDIQRRIYELTARLRKEKDPREKNRLFEERKVWDAKLSETTLSAMSDDTAIQARQIVTGYLIKKYEESIPNSKVMSMGDAFVKTTKLVMATTVKDSPGIIYNGKSASYLAQKTESFSKARNPGKIPNVMLAYGLHPFADAKLVTHQASAEEGDKRMCLILQLPALIDAERYRDVIRGQNILKDFLTRVARKGGFESGVVSLKWFDWLGVPVVSTWTSAVLTNREIFKDKKSIQDFVDAVKDEYKFIYIHKKGCTHAGASDIVLYPSPDDPGSRFSKYHHQVEREFLLAAKAPVSIFMHDGDATQGYNHDYQKNVHPDDKRPQAYQKELTRIAKNSNLSPEEKIKKLVALSFVQRVRSGVLMPQDQVEEYVDSLEYGLEYFINILRNGKKAGLSFDGSLSLVMSIMGNHNANTYKNSKIIHSDAREINSLLRVKLLDYLIKYHLNELKSVKSIRKLPSILDSLNSLTESVATQLSAPQYGTLGEARGCLRIKGKKAYAIVLKHKQGKMDKTQERAYRRSIKKFEIGLPVLNNSGDDHKGGIRITRDMLNVKTGCEQGEGPFGREIDGSEQNVFSVVYGVPVGGFNSGPIVFMILDTETMRRYALKPFPVDGKKLFPHAFEG